MDNRQQNWQNKQAPHTNPVSSAIEQAGDHGSPLARVTNEFIISEYERNRNVDFIRTLFDLYQLLLGMQCSDIFIDQVMSKLEFL